MTAVRRYIQSNNRFRETLSHITASATGTMPAQVISSFIEQRFGIAAVIVVSSILMLLCVALLGMVSIRDKAGGEGD